MDRRTVEARGFQAELEFAKALAAEAAELARTRAARVTPQEKRNLSYVTDLDQDLENFLRGRIAARYPDDQLTGEEYAPAGGQGSRRWSIDPIDGTGNLVHGMPLWAISIGLLDAGEPVLGVIAVPPLWELFWAVKGAAPGRTGLGSPRGTPSGSTRRTTSRSARTPCASSTPEPFPGSSATSAARAAS